MEEVLEFRKQNLKQDLGKVRIFKKIYTHGCVLLVRCRGVSAPPPKRPVRPAPVVHPAGQVGYLLPADPRPKQRVQAESWNKITFASAFSTRSAPPRQDHAVS